MLHSYNGYCSFRKSLKRLKAICIIRRSFLIFMANQLNSLSTPLIANVFFLLEKYFEVEEQNNILKTQLEVIDKKDGHIRC